MAITNNGTKVSVSSSKLPVGYVAPVVVEFNDAEYDNDLTLEVLKSTVENADPLVTMANILADAAIGITKQIDDILAADYVATQTVDAFAELKDISLNNLPSSSSDFMNDTATSYICTVRLMVKTA